MQSSLSKKERSPSAKRRDAQTERSADTINKLLEATIDLLYKYGYSKFRIADVIKNSKVSRGGRLHHFATKKDLVESAIEQLFVDEISQQTKAANTSSTDVIRHAAQAISDFHSSRLYRVIINMLISTGRLEQLTDGVRDISIRSRNQIDKGWINSVVQLGFTTQESEEILGLLWSVQRGIFIENLTGSNPCNDQSHELEFVISLLNEHLKVP
ncbi:MAG: hypothetical protein CME43_08395 [Haliea sp.]|uniref:TetR/AcrR family transcriptional regulator n=1 Tax=Haliea sp. TaxID=1932666 RepID=UPI000C4435D2|nr:TetR/AcrR family transcriptional regulator [Haliea sp.]MBM69482.1 hypothetical protein [Haliea sp.]